MMTFLSKLISFFKPSVDSVIANFTNTVDKLEELGKKHDAKNWFHLQEAAAHEEFAQLEQLASVKAKLIAANIRKIIS